MNEFGFLNPEAVRGLARRRAAEREARILEASPNIIAEAHRADTQARVRIAERLIIRGELKSACNLLGDRFDCRRLSRPDRVVCRSGYRARMVNKRKRRALKAVVYYVDQTDQKLPEGFNLDLLDGVAAPKEAQLGHQLIGLSGHREAPVSDTDEPATRPAAAHRLSEASE